MPYLHGKSVWFEHQSARPEVAERFYSALFGWRVAAVDMGGGMPYRMIHNGEQGIGGMLASPDKAKRSAWMSYLSVADVDATAGAARAAGAQVVMPPTDFAPMGRGATFVDPTGATISVWKSNDGDPPDQDPTPAGAWAWNELWTPDDAKARAFYARVFGYDIDAMDMGPGGMYYMLMKDGKARGGLTRSAQAKALSLWLPYVTVADCDASQAKARGLGAKVLVPATDIPNMGRFAILEDPTGAAVALFAGA